MYHRTLVGRTARWYWHDGTASDKRKRKRQEAHDVRREIEEELHRVMSTRGEGRQEATWPSR